jgi:16S rRNA (cytidine1402-2'-O)-methyltransferase
MNSNGGLLWIVPTPIGNLGDITFRAVETLKEADGILAEDTRNTGRLLKHYAINTPMLSFHSYNEHMRLKKVMEQLNNGQRLALVSDAGTPGISDPGFLLIREAVKHKFTVTSLPGATAFIPALINSGLPSDRFVFEGFLPVKKGRNKRLEQLAGELRTMIFYESPFRLVKTLKQFIDFFGPDRSAAVCRELTKLYEENVRGSLSDLWDHFNDQKIKGEIVIIVAGNEYRNEP